MMRRAALAGALAAGLSVAAAAAQVYRGGTDLVLLSVTVTDGAGRHVPGLQREDFRIYEDGVPQEIAHFSSQPEPISLSLLIDTSTSMEMERKLTLAQQAASGFVSRLGPGDVAQIIDFDSQTKILAPFTGDKAELDRALRLTKAGGSTSLYNAIYTSLSELRRLRGQSGREARRQAIVLLSDGEDTASLVSDEQVLELAKKSEINIYAISLRPNRASDRQRQAFSQAEYLVNALTRETGGRAFFPSSIGELESVYERIAEELRTLYSVGYVSSNARRDGKWRRIVVRVPDREGITVRHKLGYYAPR